MKYKDESGQWKDLVLPATGDTLPVGTVVEFEGDAVPSNWTKVEEIKPNDYTTEEQVIGTWMGRPLYRKIINGITGSTKEVWSTITTIPNIDRWHIPRLSFVLYKSDNEHYVNLFNIIDFMVNSSSQLQTKHYSDYYGNCEIEVTIEYTKTTD